MAVKTVEIDGIGPVSLYKRRGAKNLRLSVSGSGQVRVTMPHWVPYSAGVSFAKQKREWLAQQAHPQLIFTNRSLVGKRHLLVFINEPGRTKVMSRISKDDEIVIKLPPFMKHTNSEAQKAALAACVRALKKEAEAELPSRLRQIATDNGFKFKSVEIKRLRSRWGSCNSKREITLNLFLMQLPWDLIDYVLLHELVHTRTMAHGPKFWAEMAKYVPDLPNKRKQMRVHRPIIVI